MTELCFLPLRYGYDNKAMNPNVIRIKYPEKIDMVKSPLEGGKKAR